MRRFAPYYKKYTKILVIDLFCAALTTICEIVLPLILRYITNQGIQNLASLTVRTVWMLGAVYLGLRVIDGIANFYMAYTGHVMGARRVFLRELTTSKRSWRPAAAQRRASAPYTTRVLKTINFL